MQLTTLLESRTMIEGGTTGLRTWIEGGTTGLRTWRASLEFASWLVGHPGTMIPVRLDTSSAYTIHSSDLVYKTVES
jgi:hypothetical protein